MLVLIMGSLRMIHWIQAPYMFLFILVFSKIEHCDLLHEQARCNHLARLGIPIVFPKAKPNTGPFIFKRAKHFS